MWQKWKNFLKWFLPPPTKAFNREVDRILGEISRKERETVSSLMEEIANRERNTVSVLMEEISRQERNTVSLLMEEISKRERETVASLMEEISRQEGNTVSLLMEEIAKREQETVASLREEMEKQEGNTVSLLMEEISRQEGNTVSLLMEEIAKREQETVASLREEMEKQEGNTVSLLMEEIAKREQETVAYLIEDHSKNKNDIMTLIKEKGSKQEKDLKHQTNQIKKEIDYLVAVTIREDAIDHKEFLKMWDYNQKNDANLRSYDWRLQQSPEEYPLALTTWFYRFCGEWLDLENPRTKNEKIQWLKLYDSTPLKTKLADKYLCREWVAEKIGEKYLIPLLGVWDNFEEIDFDKLPNQFVLKANHGSGYNMIVTDKSQLDLVEAREKIDNWLNTNYAFRFGYELHYMNIPPLIIAEEMLGNVDTLQECDVYCSYGSVNYIILPSCSRISSSRMVRDSYIVLDAEWNVIPVKLKLPQTQVIPEKPPFFEEIKRISTTLSKEFPVIRVDFYILNEKLFIGELTFTPTSGTSRLTPRKYERIFGDDIVLPEKKEIPYKINSEEKNE